MDALRGIAALLVLVYHIWKIPLFSSPDTTWQWRLWHWTPLNLLITGRPWVILFFVLSGFVLACSLERAVDYRRFVLRRLCRVHLPFVGSILFSLVAYTLVQPEQIPSLSHWFNDLAWSQTPTLGMIARHLLMTGIEGDDGMNPIMWSLVYELRISLAFPWLFLAANRWPLPSLIVGLLTHVAAGVFTGCGDIQCQPFRGKDIADSAVLTVYFVEFFIFGILLARYRAPLQGAIRGLSMPAAILLGVAAIYAMILPNIPSLMPVTPADLSFGLGAVALICLAIGRTGWIATLQIWPMRWLGRASYSLYLTHNIVILAVVHLLYGVSRTMLLACIIMASLLAAEVSYRFLEAPALRLGKRIGAR